MKITVSQRHIERGEVSEGVIKGLEHLGKRRAGTVDGCPVAIAINEQIPTCDAIVPGRCVLLRPLLQPSKAYVVAFPESARLFVMAFDIFHQCGHVAPQLKPFSFELDVPAGLVAAEEPRRSPTGKEIPLELVKRDASTPRPVMPERTEQRGKPLNLRRASASTRQQHEENAALAGNPKRRTAQPASFSL